MSHASEKSRQLRELGLRLDRAKSALEAADFDVNQRRREVERIEGQIEAVKHPPPKRATHLFAFVNTATCGILLTDRSEVRYDRRGWRRDPTRCKRCERVVRATESTRPRRR